MPSLDAYQNIPFDDCDAIAVWLLAHRMRHGTYAKAASLLGFGLDRQRFGAYPDDVWFAQHASAHQGLLQFMPSDDTVSMTALTQFSWDTQNDFDAWMKNHTHIHQLLDQSFRIF